MRSVTITLSDDHLSRIREYHTENLSSGSTSSMDELSETQAREAVARRFESKGYPTQADEMRSGEMDVEPYVDALSIADDSPDVPEMLAEILKREVL